MEYKCHTCNRYINPNEGSTKRDKVNITDLALKTLRTSITGVNSWVNERSIFKNYSEVDKSCIIKSDNTTPEEKLPQLFSDDKKIDGLVVKCAGKLIHTIQDLSNELRSAHETVNVFKKRNEFLEIKTDKFKAMIRVSSGNSTDFRERVDELNNLVRRMDEETHMLNNSLESISTDECANERRTKNIELLVKELKTKLENDWYALFTVGTPYWFIHTKKIAKLEDSLNSLLCQLGRTTAELNDRSYDTECAHSIEYLKAINELEELVKRVGSDLKSLKIDPMKIGCKVGGESRTGYVKRIKTLEKLVETSESIINRLIIESRERSEEKRAVQDDRVAPSSRYIKGLEVLAKKFKSNIEDLEIVVATDGSKIFILKIKELENSIKRLNKEVAVKDEENSSISLELTGAKIAYREKVEALEKLQLKYGKIVDKMKNHGQPNADEDQHRIENLVRELEQTKRVAQDAKALGDELNGLRLKVGNLEEERVKLLKEINKNRATIKDKESQLLRITKQKDTVEKTLTKNTEETNRKLINAEEERKCLIDEISKLKDDIESNRCQSITNEATDFELNRLKTLVNHTTENLKKTSNDRDNCKSNLNEVITEKTRIELELSRMKIQNEALIEHLKTEKVTTTETLEDFRKIMEDFQLQESELHTMRTERSSLKKNLEQLERDKVALTADLDKLRQGNIILRDETLFLKSRVESLTQDFEKSNCRETELNIQLKKLEEENRAQRITLDSMIVETEKLNDELKNTRSTSNKCRVQYEDTKNLLDSKIEEIKMLKDALHENEELKVRGASTKLEITRRLEETIELRGTIDVLNSDKAGLEEQLKGLNNECQALRSELAMSQSDNDVLREESSGLRRRADVLMENVKKLTSEVEQRALEHKSLDSENRAITEKHQRLVDDYETEHNTLKIELERLRTENASLKLESNRMSVENEKIRRSIGKKGELSRLTVENEGLKFELANLRNSNSKADKEAKEFDIVREKLCQELQALHTEKCTLRILLEKTLQDSQTLRERLADLEVENDALRKEIGEAKNNIACRDDKTNKLEAKRTILESAIEELKKRQRDSRTESEVMRSQNEKLAKDISHLNKEDVALREELNSLRSVIKTVNDDNSRMRTEFANVEEELEALKGELARARVENSLLKTQFDAKKTESCKLESENRALKEKLEKVRQSKMSEAEDENQLRSDFEMLKLHKVTLESKLMDALQDIGKYNVATSKLKCLEDKLKAVLKDYVGTKRLLRSANEEIDHLRRATTPQIKTLMYNENVD